MPTAEAAVGWRVAVYWPADRAFYAGQVAAHDASTGHHEVAYDDGERGTIALGVDRLKWILPPGVAGGRGAGDRLRD